MNKATTLVEGYVHKSHFGYHFISTTLLFLFIYLFLLVCVGSSPLIAIFYVPETFKDNRRICQQSATYF